jgi:hypothetical protein
MSRPVKEQCLAWWQLLRFGNVFTAASNVIAGFLISQPTWEPLGTLPTLVVASAFLYLAGMVLNDAFDAKLDAVERPERPIPSGRISRAEAYLVGWILLTLGILCGWLASWLTGMAQPGVVATLLALAVVGYDAGLKNTPFGPWAMGACRLLNVLLGASFATQPYALPILVYGTLVTLYTIGLTYFARSENEDHVTINHRLGECFIGSAIFGLIFFPVSSNYLVSVFDSTLSTITWIVCWAALFTYSALSYSFKLEWRQASFHERVSRLIRGFILFDAFVVFMTTGIGDAVIVLALLIPTWIASRFAPMT